jgi:hypothetical protein
MPADQPLSIVFSDILEEPPNKVAGADLMGIVTYQWWFVPIQFQKHFRFVTRKQPDGTLQWYSLPIEE